MRVVAAATYASQMSGSGIGTSSPPGIFPVGEYGYSDWYPVGTTTCSTVQSDSKPSSSASCASPTAFAGSENGPPLLNITPNFMPVAPHMQGGKDRTSPSDYDPPMRIGILGATGPAGRGLAARLASVGHEVLFGSRAVDKARAGVTELEKEWGDLVAGRLIACDNAWACDAPVVILAVQADGAIPTVQEHAERLPGKIVVSMANNLVKHGNEFNAVLPPHGSVAAEIQALLWRSRVCTAFHLVPAAEFAALDHEMESDVVVLGDDDEAKATVMDITSSIPNLRPLDGGSLRNAVGMETFAAVLLTVNIRHKMRASLRLTSV